VSRRLENGMKPGPQRGVPLSNADFIELLDYLRVTHAKLAVLIGDGMTPQAISHWKMSGHIPRHWIPRIRELITERVKEAPLPYKMIPIVNTIDGIYAPIRQTDLTVDQLIEELERRGFEIFIRKKPNAV
jgi:hypothetical protein